MKEITMKFTKTTTYEDNFEVTDEEYKQLIEGKNFEETLDEKMIEDIWYNIEKYGCIEDKCEIVENSVR